MEQSKNPEVKKGIPTLENWQLIANEEGIVVAYGQVFNDHRWSDGTHVRTSPVEYVRAGQLRTLNTTYKLGTMNGTGGDV